MKPLTCPVGTILTVSKPPVIHYGIYAGNGMVIDNSPTTGGVTKRSVLDFSNGSPVEISDAPKTHTQGSARLEEAQKHLGMSYNLLNWNCEHFARFISEGRARSTQVACTATGTILGATIGSSWRSALVGGFVGILFSKCIPQG